jgi:SAM-dependent methyltransferase
MYSFDYRGVNVKFPEVGKMYAAHFSVGHFYEHAFLEYIASLNRGGTYLDVGCNLGNHTLFFAKFTQCTRVIAFEPLKRFSVNIKRVIAMNDIASKVLLVESAAGEFNGPFKLTFLGESYEVSSVTIDSLDLNDVTCMKIDVEGMEAHVIRGALDTIRRCRPVLFVEANTENQRLEVEKILLNIDYHLTGNVFNVSPTYEFSPAK